jgi:hypothetical protein
MRRLLVLIIAVLFAMAIAAVGFAGGTISGSVAMIDGDKITVKASDGKEVLAAGEGKTLKVGDKVFVHDGKVSKKRPATH